jgi:uncharacterized protein (TIRG00374 family)
MTGWRWGITGTIGLLVSIGMLAWLLYSYDLTQLTASLHGANYQYLWPVPVLVLANFVLRSIRWRGLFVDEFRRPLTSFFCSLTVGYLFNNLMPARAGDVVRVYHLSKLEMLSKSKVLATLFAERTGDLLTLMGLLAMVLIEYPELPIWFHRAGVMVAAGTLIAGLLIVFLKFYGDATLAFVLQMRRSARLQEIGNNFLAGLRGLCDIRIGGLFFFLTAVLWALEVTIASFIASAFRLEISTGNLLFVLVAITLGTLVPSSPGYVGAFEFFGLHALALVGHAGKNALSFVIVLHAVAILGAGFLGVISLGLWPATRTNRNKLSIWVQ